MFRILFLVILLSLNKVYADTLIMDTIVPSVSFHDFSTSIFPEHLGLKQP